MNKFVCASTLFLFVACSESPAEVAGEYSLSMTNRENGCNFDNWTEGESNAGVSFTVLQEEETVNGEIGGLAGAFLEVVFGTRMFSGDISGSSLSLILFGERSSKEGNCTYTINGTMNAEIDDDLLKGEIIYRPATNDNPDCQALEACTSRQEFNGTRPPK